MARIVPSNITHLALAGARERKLETLQELRARLPGAYTIFHGVHWSWEYRGYTVFGELDFVIVNQAGKALLIEQKNGSLDETDDGLVKMYTERPRNVADQVRRALENVREKFKWVHGGHANLELDYLIYCPDHRVANLSAAALEDLRKHYEATRTRDLREIRRRVKLPGGRGPGGLSARLPADRGAEPRQRGRAGASRDEHHRTQDAQRVRSVPHREPGGSPGGGPAIGWTEFSGYGWA